MVKLYKRNPDEKYCFISHGHYKELRAVVWKYLKKFRSNRVMLY